MAKFLLRRFVFSIFALIGATLVTFGLSRMAGDPRYLYAQEGGYGITEERWDLLGIELGLNWNDYEKAGVLEKVIRSMGNGLGLTWDDGTSKPVVFQYSVWLSNIVRGNWADSLLDRKPVISKIKERIPPTLKMGLAAYLFATIIGIPLGILSAVRRATFWDYLGRGFALLGQAMPVFWVGIMLVLVFSVQLRWLPTGTLGDSGNNPKYFVLPTITLGWIAAASYLRLVRSAMLEVMDSEFIKLARAKGVPNMIVIWKHGFKNALIAPLTFSSLILTGFITGAVVTETIFSIPGLGRLAFEAIQNNDFPVMVGTVLVFTFMYVVINFVTDLLYAVIDPRIRFS